MKNNLFDAHIKEQMTKARPDVPQYIWDNIVAKKDRKKPVVFWFNNVTKTLLGALVILAATGIALHFNNSNIIINKQTYIAAVKHVNIKPQRENITDEAKNAPIAILANPLILSGREETYFVQKNIIESIKKPDFQQQGLINYAQKKSILTTVYSTEITTADYMNDNTVNRNIFTTSQLTSSLFNPQLQLLKFPKSPFIPCPEVEKNAAGSKKYLEVYAGPDYVFRSISDTANSVYLQQRKASTKYLFAYSAGVRYTRVFGSGMSFRTGINYSQINEQFTYAKGRVAQNVYIINNNGDTTGTYLQSSTLYKTSTNKYKSIDIPISVGYEVGNGRIHSNISIGAMVNISSSQKGFVIDKNGAAVDITSGKSSSVYQYKTNAGVSFIGAASVYYKLNERLHLMAEPYIKLSLSPATKPEISFKEKFHTTGVRVGLRMDF